MTLLLLALAATTGKPAGAAPRKDVPVQVRCDDMVVENRDAVAHCEGHVIAVRLNVTVTCERAVAHYDDAGRITQLTCRDRVHVVEKIAPPNAPPFQRTADGDKAVYRESSRTLTLTGHATLRQPEDRLEGEPIVFYVDEDRVETRGAKLKGKAQDAVGAKDGHGAAKPPVAAPPASKPEARQ